MADKKPHIPDSDAERWLNAALSARMEAGAEPRSGLEERILARLASEAKPKPTYWWALAFIGVAAVMLIAAALLIVRPRAPEKPLSAQSGQTVRSNPRQIAAVTPQVAIHTPKQGPAKYVVAANRSRRVRQKEITPKLATFPAPTPETDQERMLARLAARRGTFEVASESPDLAVKDLQVKELTVEPMEGTPPDMKR